MNLRRNTTNLVTGLLLYGGLVGNVNAEKITKENFTDWAAKQEIVQDLPEYSSIEFNFYNLNDSGKMIITDSYCVTRGFVSDRECIDPGLKVYMDGKYFVECEEDSVDICDILTKAVEDGGIKAKREVGRLSYFWNYMWPMRKHKDCLGKVKAKGQIEGFPDN